MEVTVGALACRPPMDGFNALKLSFTVVATLLETRVHSGTLLPQLTIIGGAILFQTVTLEAI